MPLKIPGLSSLPRPFPPFGDLVHEHRTLRGMTVEELAAAANISPGAIREMEKGTRPAPPEDVVKLMATALHLSKDARETFMDSAEWESSTMGALLGRQKPQQAALPTMTASILVFLIADIRGYTHFTQEYGDQAAARLTTRFAEITRSVMERWEGHLIEVRGDEVFCVFASAQQALHAAHDLHTRCITESQAHDDLPLAIGIGLDVGEA
ncbi:MAG TPA: helix-turn-helix domain-containing protein, partial [Ktedonobacterales bacterium]|nr:helix-turn-helix domain-containing protein [Ktedonobacterales bacterium]